MKTLPPIAIGDFSVAVSVEEFDAHALRFLAECGETKWHGTMTIGGRHDHSEEQFAKDVSDFATRLAHEAAGRERSRILKSSLFGESK